MIFNAYILQGATVIPDGPIDYAGKHWSGLIFDYYQARAQGILVQAQADAAAGNPLNTTAVDVFKATLAYNFQNTYPSKYPTQPTGDAVHVSLSLRNKWGSYFASC